MSVREKLNMSMLCDFYELTMGNGYLQAGLKDRMTYFDVFSGMCRIRAVSLWLPDWTRS